MELFVYDALGRLNSAETQYAFPAGYPLVKVTHPRDSLGRLQEERYSYLGQTSGSLYRTLTNDYAIPNTSDQDFLYRRKLTYPSSWVIDVRRSASST